MTGIFVDGHDVTAQKEAEITLSNNAAIREQFIAVLGHDLRNPLAAINGGMNEEKTGSQQPNLERYQRTAHAISSHGLPRNAQRQLRIRSRRLRCWDQAEQQRTT